MDPTSEKQRLSEQHQYISNALGFVLHPTIQADVSRLADELKIANVSGGYDLSENVTCKQCVNFNIFDLRTRNTKVDEHQKNFDIVFVRVLHTSIPNEKWDMVLSNLFTLLRPGGWLQWADWDPLTPRIAAINPAASDVALRNVLNRYIDCLRDRKVGTTYRIANSMKTYGLEEDDSDLYGFPPEVQFTKNITAGLIDYLQEEMVLSEAEIQEMRTKTDEEIKVGKPLLWYDLWCHIGRRPLWHT